MTGAPTLTVELDDVNNSGTWPHDITGYVELPEGWEVARGRRDEGTEPDAGVLNLTLHNGDGRFTLGSPTYGVRKDQRIRVSESIGEVTSRRHTGYVRDWPTEWPTPLGNYALARISAVDWFARAERRKLMSQLEHEILRDTPKAYYALSEATDSISVGDRSGRSAPSLRVTGSGAPITLGTTAAPGFDGLTAADFAAGKYLLTGVPAAVTTGAPYTLTVWVRCAAAPAARARIVEVFTTTPTTAGFSIGVNTLGRLTYGSTVGTSEVDTSLFVCDGQWHLVSLVVASGSAASLRLDAGTAVALGSNPTSSLSSISVGRGSQYARYVGSAAHLAVYEGALALTRLQDQFHAGVDGFLGEGTAARVTRLASYAGFTAVAAEVGVVGAVAAASTSGQSLLAAIRDVVRAEGGVVFVNGAGSLVVQNRTHRAYSVSNPPVVAAQSDLVEHGDLRWGSDPETYLVNTASGSRVGGAEQRAVNQVSLDKYDEYPTSDFGGVLLTSDAQVLDAITYTVATYGEPRPRLPSVTTVDLRTLETAVVATLLKVEIGDRITLSGLPPTSPVANASLIVEGVTERQTDQAWSLTFNTAPADPPRGGTPGDTEPGDPFAVWTLDDSTYSVLGSTTKLHY